MFRHGSKGNVRHKKIHIQTVNHLWSADIKSALRYPFFFLIRKNGKMKSKREIRIPVNPPMPNIPPMDASAYCSLRMILVLPSGK